MRKFLLTSALVLTGLFCFSSCELDKEASYVFYYDLLYNSEAEDASDNWKVVQEYFKGKIDFTKSISFTGKQSEAVTYALRVFADDTSNLDKDEITALLRENEELNLICYYIVSDARYVVNYLNWSTKISESDGLSVVN